MSNENENLSSWRSAVLDANRREYYGLSKDIDKLPKYDDLASGSIAMCVDTGDVYIYESTSKNWYKQ